MKDSSYDAVRALQVELVEKVRALSAVLHR